VKATAVEEEVERTADEGKVQRIGLHKAYVWVLGRGATNGDRREIDAERKEALFSQVRQVGPAATAKVEHTATLTKQPGIQRPA
jgi:hypothetical protein